MGGTALHYSIGGSADTMHGEITKFLVERGADIFIKNILGKTPLQLAKDILERMPIPNPLNTSEFIEHLTVENVVKFLENAE